MKKTKFIMLLIIIIIFFFMESGFSCSTFVLKNGDLQVLGHNYDWDVDDALLMVNKRGCFKSGIPQQNERGERAFWIAKYGSITFNQYGREFPSGGMNEAGLVVKSMILDGTIYPASDNRLYVGIQSQWTQYVLDTCETLSEVIKANRKIRISNKQMGTGCHYLVMDKSGDSGVIEFINGKMKSYVKNDLPVVALTNSTYPDSLKCLKNNCMEPFDFNKSMSRFKKVAKRIRSCQSKTTEELVAFSFDTLSTVASFRTQWRIVYDNKGMMVYFFTKANKKIRYINVSKFDFSNKTPVKILDVNAQLSGDVTSRFSDYTYKANRDLIGHTFKKTHFLSKIPKKMLDFIARFPERYKCP